MHAPETGAVAQPEPTATAPEAMPQGASADDAVAFVDHRANLSQVFRAAFVNALRLATMGAT